MDPELNRREFLTGLDRLQDWLHASRIPFVIVGSLAVAAYTGDSQRLDFSREHAHDPTQRVPDIDLLVPRTALPLVHPYALAARTRARVPVHVDTFMAETYLDLRPGEQWSYLTHRALRMPASTALFAPRRAMLLGHELVTIDPRVLLHTVATVHPVIRKKDAPKIAELAEAIRSGRAVTDFSDRDCRVFARFMEMSWERYPMFMAATGVWKRTLDALPPGAAQALRSSLLPGIQRTVAALNRNAEPGGSEPARPDAGAARHCHLKQDAVLPRSEPREIISEPGPDRAPDRSPEIEP